MHHLLYDIRKDAVKKANKTSHRHSQELLEATIAKVIKAVCNARDNNDDDAKYFKTLDIHDAQLKEFSADVSNLIKSDSTLTPTMDLEYAIEYATAYYWANEPDGFTALLYFLLIRGVTLIKEGYSSEKISKLLLSYIPNGFLSKERIALMFSH